MVKVIQGSSMSSYSNNPFKNLAQPYLMNRIYKRMDFLILCLLDVLIRADTWLHITLAELIPKFVGSPTSLQKFVRCPFFQCYPKG